MFDNQGVRIEKIRKKFNLERKEFIKKLNYSSVNTYNAIASNSQKLSMNFIFKVNKHFSQVNLHWLLTGEGEMLLKKHEKMNLLNNNGNVIGNSVVITKSERELELEKENKRLREQVNSLQSEVIELLKKQIEK